MSGREGQVEFLDPAGAGEDIRHAWRDLALGRENPFLTPEWFDAWSEGGAGEPWVLAWRRQPDAAPTAVLPLVLSGGGARALRFPGADNGDWFGIASAPEDEAAAAAAFLAALADRRREWDVLRLDRVDRRELPEVDPSRAMVKLRPLRDPDVLPFLELGEGGYEGWLASRSRNFRSQLGRRRRNAERDHELALVDTPDRDGLEAELGTLFGFHEARRQMQGGEGVLDERARAAYGRFAESSLDRGWLRMHRLDLDGEPVASWYGWRLGERYMYGISGFDPEREDLAVGTLLLAHTIERAAGEGAAVYDFLWGAEAYKDRYANGRRTVDSVAAPSGLRGRLALGTVRTRNALARSIPDGARRRLRSRG